MNQSKWKGLAFTVGAFGFAAGIIFIFVYTLSLGAAPVGFVLTAFNCLMFAFIGLSLIGLHPFSGELEPAAKYLGKFGAIFLATPIWLSFWAYLAYACWIYQVDKQAASYFAEKSGTWTLFLLLAYQFAFAGSESKELTHAP